MWALLQDVRYSLRMLMRSTRVTAVAAVSLALGLGANIAIFGVVHEVLLRPPPYREPRRLVLVRESNPERGVPEALVSPANFVDFRDQSSAFESMAAYERASLALTGAGEPEQLRGLLVSEGFFRTLGVNPRWGRDFLPVEAQPGGGDAVVVSYGFWDRRFGRDPGLLGSSLTLNGRPRTVVGIMRSGFEFPDRGVELWLPRAIGGQDAGRGYRRLSGLARLKPGVSQEWASRELNHIAARLGEQYPVSNRGWRVKLAGLLGERVETVRPALLVLLGAVGLVLLIGCANIASLLLARNAARAREMAVRAALGAGRGRLLRQLLLESLLLALAGGGLGLLLHPWMTRLLLSLSPQELVLPERVGLRLSVVAFGLSASLLTALLCGLAPALHGSRTELVENLKEGGRSGGGGTRRQRLRSVLVVAEVAVALVLMAGAGVMLRSFLRLKAVDPGFRADRVLTVRLGLTPFRYLDEHRKTAFYRAVLERVRVLPGVEAAAATNHLPMVSDFGRAFTIGARPVPPPGEWPAARFRAVTPDYFRAMGIPLLRGRVFTEQDDAESPGVALINQSLARRYWPGEDPLGHRVNLTRPELQHAWRTVVGVVGDVRHTGLDAEIQPEVYAPYYQMPEASTTLVARVATEPLVLAAAVRAAVRAVDPDQPVGEVRTMQRVVAESEAMGSRRAVMLLLSAFAALAVLLATIGVYGVISYSVAQRTQEIGVRMALGAAGGDLVRMVVRQALGLTLAGVTIGTLAGLALTRFLSQLVFGVSPADPVTFAAVAALLLTVALAASYLPARAATRVDPLTALRAA